jgi:plasmid stability protein
MDWLSVPLTSTNRLGGEGFYQHTSHLSKERFSMATITLKGVPDKLKERIQVLAGREGHSLNKQAIYLLERAVREEPTGFDRAYQQFRERQGESPLEEGDLSGIRSEGDINLVGH